MATVISGGELGGAMSTAPSPELCVGCGAACPTPFCASCGEQRAADRQYSLVHFGAEVLEAFTQADSKLLRTVSVLVTCPGGLTTAYMAGKRKLYVPPLQFFLMVNVVFFLAGVSGLGVHTLDTPLWVQMNAVPYRELTTGLVNERLAARGTTLASYSAVFDRTSTTQAKSLVIVMIPAFAAIVALVTLPRRRYVVQHIVFSLHAYTMLLLILIATNATAMLLRLTVMRAGGWQGSSQSLDDVITIAIALVSWLFLAAGLRRAYGFGSVGSAARALVLTLSVGALLMAYRCLLFFATFVTT